MVRLLPSLQLNFPSCIASGREKVEDVAFPPRIADVLAWSTTFRCALLPSSVRQFVVSNDAGVLARSRTISGTSEQLATHLVVKRHLSASQLLSAP